VARRTFEVIDIVEILIHWYAGRSQHELAASLGVDRKTQRKYTRPARAAGMEPGGPPMAEADWRTLVTGWFPELADSGLRQVSWPRIECHRDYVAAQLKAGVTVSTVHQRLVDEHGLDASVASVRRWVRANLPEDARRTQVTVLRDTPQPGQEAQIDYGKLGMWLDPRSGRRRTVWAFAGGVVLFAAHVRAPDVADGSGRVDRRARGGVRVLRRRPGPARARKCSAEHFRSSVAGSVMWPRVDHAGRGGG